MALRVLRQVAETLQLMHAAGINHHVTAAHVYVDVFCRPIWATEDVGDSRYRITLTNVGMPSGGTSVASDIAQVGHLITQCETSGVDLGARIRSWANNAINGLPTARLDWLEKEVSGLLRYAGNGPGIAWKKQ